MPRRPSLAVKNTPKGFLVHVPASMSGSGQLERRYFRVERDANAFAGTLRTKYHTGLRGGIVTAGTGFKAAEAERLLKDTGIDLLQAVRAFVEAKAILDPFGATLADAARAYAENAAARGVNETFADRYARFVADNEGDWSDRYRRDMEKVPQWVGEEFMARPVATITPAIIEDALRGNGASAKSTRKARAARVLPVLNERTRKRKASGIEIMTDEQVAAMIGACQGAEERRLVGLLLFAGIRPDIEGELGRLDWSAVRDDSIYIAPEVSKTGTDRFIPITPRLRSMIQGHPSSGPVTLPNHSRRIQAIRKTAGIAGKQDITRHTFASHFLAAYGEDATKAAMGHTPNSGTLFRHYRRAVTETAGQAYFA